MTLYVHIGTHKTGTSSIQQFFGENIDTIYAATGVYYPRTGQRGGAAHHNLVWDTVRDDRFQPEKGSWFELYREIAMHRPKDILLSCEAFSAYPSSREFASPLRGLAREFSQQLQPILFLRPQPEYLESLYIQTIKSGMSWSFNRFLKVSIDKARFDYLSLFDDWSERIAAPHVRIYDGSNSIPTICDVLGIDVEKLAHLLPDKRANPRLTESGLEELRYHNLELRQAGKSKAFIRERAMKRAKRLMEKSGKRASLLTPQARERITTGFETTNAALAAKLGLASLF